MYKRHITATAVAGMLSLLASSLLSLPAVAQQQPQQPADQSVHFRVNGPTERLEMIVSTSRIVTLGHKVPKMLVNNPAVVTATPLSPNQIQLSAQAPGVTQLNIWDENERVYSVDVVVTGDARELLNTLKTVFPDAALKVRPLASSVVISGYVPNTSMVSQIVRICEDYYPNVINNMKVGGVQTVLLHTKVMEVSRTKLRKLGIDFAEFNGDDAVISGVSGLIQQYTIAPNTVQTGFSEQLAVGLLTGPNQLLMFVEALRQHNLVKLLAEPTLVTTSGRPASFASGGEFPIVVPQSLGTVSIEYRTFGTRVDYVPIVLGNGRLRLEVRPLVSEIDPARSVNIQNVNVPGLRARWVDTAVEMQAGQTLALAGLIQNRVESENKGIPILADIPWAGSLFRRVEERINEVELVILVTPEIVEAMDPHEVPPCGPGQLTTSPSNHDLYGRGHLEVPRCCPDGRCGRCGGGQVVPPGVQYQEVVPTPPAAAPTTAPSRVVPVDPAAAFEARRRTRNTATFRSTSAPRQQTGSSRQQTSRTRQRTGTPRQRTTARPVVRPVRTSPNNRYNPAPAQPKSRSKSTLREPNLFGPVGYDEIK